MEELEAIIEKMKSNGESQETIDLVVNEYKKRNPNVDFQTPTAPGAVVEETAAPDMDSNLVDPSLVSPGIPKQIGSELDGMSIKDIRAVQPNKKSEPKIKPGTIQAAYNILTLQFPKSVDEFQMQLAGKELQGIVQEQNDLEQRFNETGEYSWDVSEKFIPDSKMSSGGQFITSKKTGTKEEAEKYYSEKRKELELEFLKNLVESQEYQAELDKFETVKLFDEDGNFNIDFADVRQITGEQIPQMLGAVLTFGGSTLIQESSGVAQRLLDKTAAEENGLTEQEFFKLSNDEQNRLKLNLINEGKAGGIFETAMKTGAENAGMDLISNFFVVGKATKFLPKSTVRNLVKGKVTKAIKGTKGYVTSQGLAQIPEVITENAQEINSAWASRDITSTDDLFSKNTWNQIKETTVQTIIGTSGTQISIGGTNFARKEAIANLAAVTNPNALRSIVNDAKQQVNASTSLTEDEKLDRLETLDQMEELTNNSQYKKLTGDSKKNVFLNLVDKNETQKNITNLENALEKEKKLHEEGWVDLSTEAKLSNEKNKLESYNNNITKEIILNNYRSKGKSLAEWVNTQQEGYFADKTVHIKQNKKELEEYLKLKDPTALEQENVQGLLNNDGFNGVKYGNNVYIIDDNIKTNVYKGGQSATNVVHHEILHLIMDGVDFKKKIELKNKIESELKNSNDPEIKLLYDNLKIRLANYANASENVKLEEFFANLSDALRLQNIGNIEQAGLFNNIGDNLAKMFSETVPDKPFDINAENALEFIKKFNSFQGKTSIKEKIFGVGKAIADAAPKGKVDIKDEEALASLEKLTPEIQQSVVKNINELKIARQESIELNKKFNKEGIKTNKEESIERKITNAIKPTVDSFVENRTKALYDPIAPDAKKNVTRQEFRESMKTDISNMVFNEYDPSKQTVEKFITNRGFLRANDLANRLGIKSVEQGIDKQIDEQVTETALDDGPQLEEVKEAKKIKPSKIYSKEQYEKAKQLVVDESVNLDPETLSFKKLGNITAKITEEVSKVPAKKFLNAASNLTKDEVRNGRMFINKNISDVLKTLPQGAVLMDDKASEKLLGTATGVPKGILNSPLYIKQARGTKGAGLSPYKLNPNASTKMILDLIGKPGDPISSRSPQAQNVKSFIKLFDKNITNEIYRAELDLDPQIRINIEAGKAVALASKENFELAKKLKLEKSWYDIKNKEDAVKYAKEMRTKILPYFKEYPGLITLGSLYNGHGVFKLFKGKTNELKRKELRSAFQKEFLKDKNWVKKRRGYVYGRNDNIATTKFSTGDLKRPSKEINEINKINKLNFINGWNALNNAIKDDPKNLIPILHFLENAISEGAHFHRKGAELVGFDKEALKAGKEMTFEHALQNANAYRFLAEAAIKEENYNKPLFALINNYKLIAIDKDDDNKLNDAKYTDENGKEVSFKNNMGKGWDVYNNNWYERYANKIVANINGGFNFNNIVTLNGNTFSEVYNINSKGKIALASKENLDLEFNKIIENKTKIGAEKRYGDAKAAVAGKGKGKFDILGIPPSAQDFMGLMYVFLGKGKEGDRQLEWIRKNLTNPFAKAMVDISNARVALSNDYKEIKKIAEIAPKDLKEKIPGEPFTLDHAVRVYIWNKQGMEIPGISQADKKELSNYIAKDEKRREFANKLIQISKENGYPKADKNWLAGTISTDLLQGLNTTTRKQALTEWQENVDIIFSKTNLNKLEAAFGKGYRLALENILDRMKTGTNRKFRGDSLTGRFTDWINGSVGAIMFFNMRSAVLQTISAVNFVNWNDNNVFKAAKAFANQPQYWKDVMFIMNSDYLVERRNGLKINVNEADIAEIAAESNNKAKAFINKLLKLGFLPTQIADSFAIASGGATFYRNRFNSYIKEGLSQKEAQEKAFLDFREISEEAQQSSRPDRISQQQAGELGRIILAFANTPAQYARIIQRAASDLKNGRGDAKTNISKILYYGIIQNIIFNALQQALFAMAFDEEPDEEQENKKHVNIANGMADSLLRGMGFHGAAISTVKNAIMKISEGSPAQDTAIELINISPPISSKIRKVRSAGRTWDWNKKDIKEKGLSLDNPAFLATGQLVSATTNIPLDRGIKKLTNIKDALDTENEEWMRVANALGWSKWELEWTEPKKKKTKKYIQPKQTKQKSFKRKTFKRN